MEVSDGQSQEEPIQILPEENYPQRVAKGEPLYNQFPFTDVADRMQDRYRDTDPQTFAHLIGFCATHIDDKGDYVPRTPEMQKAITALNSHLNKAGLKREWRPNETIHVLNAIGRQLKKCPNWQIYLRDHLVRNKLYQQSGEPNSTAQIPDTGIESYAAFVQRKRKMEEKEKNIGSQYHITGVDEGDVTRIGINSGDVQNIR